MKYIKFSFGAMLCAATCMFSSCYESGLQSLELNTDSLKNQEEATTVKINQSDVTYPTDYTYSITANSSADIVVNNSKVTQGSSYKGSAKVGTLLNIEATSRSTSETITKMVTLDANGKKIVIDFQRDGSKTNKKVSNALNSAATDGAVTIYGTSKQLYSNAITSYITFSEKALNAAISNGLSTEDNLLIQPKNPTSSTIAQNLDAVTENIDLLTITTSPENIKLGSETATIALTSENFEKNMSFSCEGIGKIEMMDAHTIQFDVNELKDYTITADVKVEYNGTDSITDGNYFKVPIGNQDITYYTKSGYTCTYTSNDFINKYLKAKFGEYTDKAVRTIKIRNTQQTASVRYEICQAVHHYKVYFGDMKLDVDVYGGDRITVFTAEAKIVK
ncbi:MAG: hypothetical protein K6E54_09435 [Bacteroidaceae bacterium]|nr:hypothetical protein [Bacteroidaceae bacterium]